MKCSPGLANDRLVDREDTIGFNADMAFTMWKHAPAQLFQNILNGANDNWRDEVRKIEQEGEAA